MSPEADGTGGAEAVDAAGGEGADENGRDTGYVETTGPLVPEAVSWLINPLVSAVLQSPLHPLLSDSILLLTFTGQQSGTDYTIPVAYWRKESTLVLMTHGTWWHNLQGGQPVSIHIQGRERTAVATPYTDPETVAEYMQQFILEHGLEEVHRLGIRVHGDREPTLAELEAGIAGVVVVELELEG